MKTLSANTLAKATSLLTKSFLVSGLVLLSACGGGGSSAPPVTITEPPAPVEVAQTVRTRALEGLDVLVTPYKMSNVASTVPTRVEIKVSDASVVSGITASIGQNFDTAAAVTATQTSSGVWNVTWPANVASDSGLLVTVTLKTGDVLETGLTDFQFN